ncbi:MAG: arylsulfatase [Pirellulales bacterium]
MKRLPEFLTFLTLVLCVGHAAQAEAARTKAARPSRPNIVLIMADDMGYSDLGCYGSEIRTPNLDRLAAGGLRFTQFYNTARCCPTRASLLTGLYPHQAGIGHMVNPRPRFPAYQGFLNDRCVTIAEVLAPSGYCTLMSGKWHVGENRPHWPLDRGFEHYFGLISGASNYWRLDPGRQMARDNEPYTPAGDFYMTDALGQAAVQFVDRYGRGERPFFLYMAFTSPHWPLHARPEDIARYQGKYLGGWDALRQSRHRRMIELGIVDARWELTPRDSQAPAWDTVEDKAAWDRRMAVYAAQIDRMDQNIGKILEKVRQVGAEENTLVLFLADNGGCAEKVNSGKPGVPPGPADSFMSYGLPWANASNTPFRLYKHWVHEGGISTPLIAYWPAVIRQRGALTHQPGHLIDIMATCADVAGAKYPEQVEGRQITPMEGQSLLPIFRGETRPDHASLFWEHEGNRAVREGKWKLVSRYPGKWELYDLDADRTEMHDLAAAQPDKVAEMAAHYKSWAGRVGAVPWGELQGKKAKAK